MKSIIKENIASTIQEEFRKNVPGFSLKTYWHFDKEYMSSDLKKIKERSDYITSPEKIAKHPFYPFIANTKVERRIFRKKQYYYYKKILEENADNIGIAKVCRDKIDDFEKNNVRKVRAITYASHLDSHIYSYYSNILSELYEKQIEGSCLQDEIVAYRKLDNTSRNGISTSFYNLIAAYDAINEIKRRHNDCYVLTFDLSHFFETIDHKKLKEQWCRVLGVSSLPADHYNIYKSITKYCYVEKNDLIKYAVSKSKKEKKHSVNLILSRIFSNAESFRYFRKEFKSFRKNPGISDITKSPHGIPQGCSISTVLSNIYMLPFDKCVSDFVHSYGGFYRRFCDDFIVILPRDPKVRDSCIFFIQQQVKQRGDFVELHPIHDWDRYSKSQCYDFGNLEEIKRNPLDYLGISYDGINVRLRQSSVTKYQRKVIKAVRACTIKAKRILISQYEKENTVRVLKKKNIFIDKKSLYKGFSFKGTDNFISYANTVARMFDSDAIKRQLKSHCHRLSKMIDAANVLLRQEIKSYLKTIRKERQIALIIEQLEK